MDSLCAALILLVQPARAQVQGAAVLAEPIPGLALPARPFVERVPAEKSRPSLSVAAPSFLAPRPARARLRKTLRLAAKAVEPAREPASAEQASRDAAKGYEAALAALDPDAAERAVHDPRLAGLPGEDPRAAASALWKAYALSDLAGLVEHEKRIRSLNFGLGLRLKSGSPLEALGLGSEKALLDWVRRYRPANEGKVKAAMLSWESLPEGKRRWLRSIQVEREDWEGKALEARGLPWKWDADRKKAWMSAPVPRDAASWREFVREAKGIAVGLEPKELAALNRHFKLMRALARARGALVRAAADEGLEAFDRGASLSPEERLAGLGLWMAAHPGVFPDRLRDEINEARPSSEEESLAGVDRLPPGFGATLLSELGGVPSGERVRSLFPAGEEPAVWIENGSAVAWFEPATGRVVFNRGVVEAWLRVRGLGVRDLLSKEGVRRGFLRWAAPVFVHEATHLRQHMDYLRLGLDGGITQEDEIEALSEQSLFVLQKSAEDPDYARGVGAREMRMARRMARDFKAFERDGRRLNFKLLPLRAALAFALKSFIKLDAEVSRRGRKAVPKALQDDDWSLDWALEQAKGILSGMTAADLIVAREHQLRWARLGPMLFSRALARVGG
jgi:hypothetical protein